MVPACRADGREACDHAGGGEAPEAEFGPSTLALPSLTLPADDRAGSAGQRAHLGNTASETAAPRGRPVPGTLIPRRRRRPGEECHGHGNQDQPDGWRGSEARSTLAGHWTGSTEPTLPPSGRSPVPSRVDVGSREAGGSR